MSNNDKDLDRVEGLANKYGIDINSLGFGNIREQKDSLEVLPIQLEYINSYCKLLHNEIKLIKSKLDIVYSEETNKELHKIKVRMNELKKQMVE